MPESKIRVIIADDHTVIRKGLRFLLDSEADIEVVAEACDGHQAVILAREFRPTEIVMDLAMPEANGIEATREILSELPDTRVLIISSNCEREMINEALSSGAFGYLSKGDSLMVVPLALREIHRGGRFISTGAARFRR
jgi:DNA-binding NarL/FixJ family response regulator